MTNAEAWKKVLETFQSRYQLRGERLFQDYISKAHFDMPIHDLLQFPPSFAVGFFNRIRKEGYVRETSSDLTTITRIDFSESSSKYGDNLTLLKSALLIPLFQSDGFLLDKILRGNRFVSSHIALNQSVIDHVSKETGIFDETLFQAYIYMANTLGKRIGISIPWQVAPYSSVVTNRPDLFFWIRIDTKTGQLWQNCSYDMILTNRFQEKIIQKIKKIVRNAKEKGFDDKQIGLHLREYGLWAVPFNKKTLQPARYLTYDTERKRPVYENSAEGTHFRFFSYNPDLTKVYYPEAASYIVAICLYWHKLGVNFINLGDLPGIAAEERLFIARGYDDIVQSVGKKTSLTLKFIGTGTKGRSNVRDLNLDYILPKARRIPFTMQFIKNIIYYFERSRKTMLTQPLRLGFSLLPGNFTDLRWTLCYHFFSRFAGINGLGRVEAIGILNRKDMVNYYQAIEILYFKYSKLIEGGVIEGRYDQDGYFWWVISKKDSILIPIIGILPTHQSYFAIKLDELLKEDRCYLVEEHSPLFLENKLYTVLNKQIRVKPLTPYGFRLYSIV